MYRYVSTAATAAPISLDEAKAQLAITHSHEDVHITGLIEAATAFAEEYQRRSFINRTYTLKLDDFALEIELGLPPLVSVTSVKYYDLDGVQQTLDAAEYQVVFDNISPRLVPALDGSWPGYWPGTDGRALGVEIIYVAGYGAEPENVPAQTRHGVLKLVSDLYEHRESEIVGVMVMSMNRTALSLLRPNRVPRV